MLAGCASFHGPQLLAEGQVVHFSTVPLKPVTARSLANQCEDRQQWFHVAHATLQLAWLYQCVDSVCCDWRLSAFWRTGAGELLAVPTLTVTTSKYVDGGSVTNSSGGDRSTPQRVAVGGLAEHGYCSGHRAGLHQFVMHVQLLVGYGRPQSTHLQLAKKSFRCAAHLHGWLQQALHQAELDAIRHAVLLSLLLTAIKAG